MISAGHIFNNIWCGVERLSLRTSATTTKTYYAYYDPRDTKHLYKQKTPRAREEYNKLPQITDARSEQLVHFH